MVSIGDYGVLERVDLQCFPREREKLIGWGSKATGRRGVGGMTERDISCNSTIIDLTLNLYKFRIFVFLFMYYYIFLACGRSKLLFNWNAPHKSQKDLNTKAAALGSITKTFKLH